MLSILFENCWQGSAALNKVNVDVPLHPDMTRFDSDESRELCGVRTLKSFYYFIFTAWLMGANNNAAIRLFLALWATIASLDPLLNHLLLNPRLGVEMICHLFLSKRRFGRKDELLFPRHDRIGIADAIIPPADLHVFEGAGGGLTLRIGRFTLGVGPACRDPAPLCTALIWICCQSEGYAILCFFNYFATGVLGKEIRPCSHIIRNAKNIFDWCVNKNRIPNISHVFTS